VVGFGLCYGWLSRGGLSVTLPPGGLAGGLLRGAGRFPMWSLFNRFFAWMGEPVGTRHGALIAGLSFVATLGVFAYLAVLVHFIWKFW
jgi:hypothetical protein